MEMVKMLWRWLWFIPMALCLTGFCLCSVIALGPARSRYYVRRIREGLDSGYQLRLNDALIKGSMALEELNRMRSEELSRMRAVT